MRPSLVPEEGKEDKNCPPTILCLFLFLGCISSRVLQGDPPKMNNKRK